MARTLALALAAVLAATNAQALFQPQYPGVVPVPAGVNNGASIAWTWPGPAVSPGRTETPPIETCPPGFAPIAQKARAPTRRYGGFARDERMAIVGETVCCMPPPRNAAFWPNNDRPCGVRCRGGYRLVNPYFQYAQCVREDCRFPGRC